MLPEVAVETASSPDVRRKGRQRGGRIWAREVDAVVAEEDPAAVCRVGVAGEVCSRGRSDLHTPASIGIPCREALPENGRLRKTDRQQVHIRRPGTNGAGSDRSVDIQRCPGAARKGNRISQDRLESRRHPVTMRARPDRAVSRDTLVGISHRIHLRSGSLGAGSRIGWPSSRRVDAKDAL